MLLTGGISLQNTTEFGSEKKELVYALLDSYFIKVYIFNNYTHDSTLCILFYKGAL